MDFARRTKNRTTCEITNVTSNDLRTISGPEKNGEKNEDIKFDAIVEDFCTNTSVHGIKYFSGHHWIERVWWVCSFALSVVLCVIVILSIWTTWRNHQVSVTFDDKTTAISQIPFPAVTICTTQKFDKRIEKPYGLLADELFGNDSDGYDAVAQTCLKIRSIAKKGRISMSVYEAIKEISPSQSSVILHSMWKDHMRAVKMESIFTEEGLCFTLNSINSREIYADEAASELLTVRDNPNSTWNMENGYQSTENASKVYPYRVMGASFRHSLQIVTNITLDNSFKDCQFDSPGFFLSVHNPDDLPQFSNDFLFIPYEKSVSVLIKPTVMATSDGLRSYAPNVRGCYFRSERKLGFFKSYSQQKCEMECLANFTKKECDCVRFYMPRDENTTVCRFEEIQCSSEAEFDYSVTSAVNQCDCLPDCTSICYEYESSLVQRFHFESYEKTQQRYQEYGFNTQNKLKLLFKKDNFIMINRSETNTMSEFISSCGGLLGLFMGVSVLSIVELIYFFTLRLCCKLRKRETVGSSTDVWARHNNISMISNQKIAKKSFRFENLN